MRRLVLVSLRGQLSLHMANAYSAITSSNFFHYATGTFDNQSSCIISFIHHVSVSSIIISYLHNSFSILFRWAPSCCFSFGPRCRLVFKSVFVAAAVPSVFGRRHTPLAYTDTSMATQALTGAFCTKILVEWDPCAFLHLNTFQLEFRKPPRSLRVSDKAFTANGNATVPDFGAMHLGCRKP